MRRRAVLLPAVVGFALLAGACGGGGDDAAAPPPAPEPAPAAEPPPPPPPPPAEPGVYVGKTSQGKPVRLTVAASGKSANLKMQFKSSGCSFLETMEEVTISETGEILSEAGDVRGSFVNPRLAKGSQEGAPAGPQGDVCPVEGTITWQARLR